MAGDILDTYKSGGSDVLLSATFLEVVACGSFIGAAEKLGISQAAASLRIQTLEARLGCVLFKRGRGGARLTPDGQRYWRYALTIKQAWDQAQLELAIPSGYAGQLRFGGHYSLWRHLLLRWLHWMRNHGKQFALRTEAYDNETLMTLLADGLIDLGVTFDPRQLPGFVIDRLFEEQLVLVSTSPDSRGPDDPGYLFVDWGPEFRKFHLENFPDASLPGVRTNLGSLAVEYLLECGGTGYVPFPVIERHLKSGQFTVVKDAPRFETPIYAIYRGRYANDALEVALEGLRAVTR